MTRYVFKVVRIEDTKLVSALATGKYKREYRVGEKTFSDPPVFVFTSVYAAISFAEALQESHIAVYAGTANALWPLPNVLPYATLQPRLQDTEWDLFWNDPLQWEKQYEAVVNHAPPQDSALAYSLALTQEIYFEHRF